MYDANLANLNVENTKKKVIRLKFCTRVIREYVYFHTIRSF